MNTLRLPLAIGETLLLMPTRTLYWERTRTLFAAELSLAGAPSDEAALERLKQAVDYSQPQRIIMLGSWFAKRCEGIPPLLADWLAQGRKLHQVGGQINTLCDLARVSYTSGPTPGPHFMLADRWVPSNAGFVLAPHNRPILLDDQPVPCFVFGESFSLLPPLNDAPLDDLLYPTSGDVAVYPIVAGAVRSIS